MQSMTQLVMQDVQQATAQMPEINTTQAELIKFTMESFRPPKKQTVSEWADANRRLVSESSSETGVWRTDRAQYQREPMNAFTQRGVWKVVIQAGSQTGKTEIALNMMGYAIDVDPGPMLFVQATDAFAADFSKRRVAPMIKACKVLSEKVAETKSRDSGNTIGMKMFPGGSVTFVGANSPTELAGRPVRYQFLDEVDRYPDSAGTEGNPIKIAERRTETFRHNRKIVILSTPTIKGKSEIEREYKAGTQEEWHVECRHCKNFSYIYFKDIVFDKTDDEQDGEKNFIINKVAWRCPICKKESGEHDTKRSAAKWVERNPKALQTGVRSFKINAFMSPWSDWKEIVREFLKAGKDRTLLQVFYNTTLGEVWEYTVQTGQPEKLYRRREHYNAEVPTGILVLTMGIDTQDNRLEYEIVGWNRNEESWGISKGIIPGRADAPGVWEEVDELLDREWKMHNGMALRVLATFIDSGGHFTQEVYRECAKRAHKRVWAIKGEGGDDKPYVRMMKAAKGGKGAVQFIIGVNSGKEAIMHGATVDEVGPRYMHYPIDANCGYDMEYFRGLLSERMMIRRRGGKSTIIWEQIYAQNEPLDIRNYARAAYKYFNWNFDKLEMMFSGAKQPPLTITQAQRERKKNKHIVSSGIQV